MKVLTLVFSHPGQRAEWPAILERLGEHTLIFHGGAEETARTDKILAIAAPQGFDFYPETVIHALRHVLTDASFSAYTHYLMVFGNVDKVDMSAIEAAGPLEYFGPRICDPARASRTMHCKLVAETSPWAKEVYKGPMVAWCDGTRGYVINRRSAEIVNETALSATMPLIRSHEIYADLMVAKMLHGHGITPKRREIGVTYRNESGKA